MGEAETGPPGGDASQGGPWRGRIEWALLLVGGVVLLASPHWITGDGAVRFETLDLLLREGRLGDNGYSLIGPLFSAPLWLAGRVFLSPDVWCSAFNVLVFLAGVVCLWRCLAGELSPDIRRRFLLLLVLASMFPHHVLDYYGEVFTAVLVAVGTAAICLRGRWWGWGCLVVGVANTPASVAGLGLMALFWSFRVRRWRYLLAPVAATLLVLLEAGLRRGDPFRSGYEGDHGYPTVMPYSGLPGFSYPFLFGVLSLLFSFGKGLFLFGPGLLLAGERRGLPERVRGLGDLWLAFLLGLVLVYARWWSWYGGWFWGPRFLLFASVPASLFLAAAISRGPEQSLGRNLIGLGILWLSFWVGLSGLAFGQEGLGELTANDYALEMLVWYTPEYSVLGHPLVSGYLWRLDRVCCALWLGLCCLYVGWPLTMVTARQAREKLGQLWRDMRQGPSWRF